MMASILLFVRPAMTPFTQPATAGWTFTSCKQTLTTLIFQVTAGSPEDQALTAMSHDLDTIRQRYLVAYGNSADSDGQIAMNLPAEYSRSMLNDFARLKSLPTSGAPRLSSLKEIEADLHIKATAAVSGMSGLVSTSFPAAVEVVVTVTLGPRTTVSGLNVRGNAHYRGIQSPADYIFSPSSGVYVMKLPPGRFWFWVQSGKNILYKSEEDIGLAGSSIEHRDYTL